MINPYSPPLEPLELFPSDRLVARFRLTQSDLANAKSRYLLRLYGARLTLISFVMIAVAVTVPLVLISHEFERYWVILGELAVALVAAAAYQGSIYRPAKEVDQGQNAIGLVGGAECEFSVLDGRMHLSTPAGDFSTSLRSSWAPTRQGLLVFCDPAGFWLVPKRAAFSSGGYRKFVEELRRLAAS